MLDGMDIDCDIDIHQRVANPSGWSVGGFSTSYCIAVTGRLRSRPSQYNTYL